MGEDTRASVDASLRAFEGTLPGIIATELAALAPRRLEVQRPDAPPVLIPTPHKLLERVLRYCNARLWPYLVGPAGSGKTTLAQQVAVALGLPYYEASKIDSKFDLFGFTDASGTCVRTPFREAYEHGGCFLLDEADASNPNAFTALNSAIANGGASFPDGYVQRHPDFVLLAAANTYGMGRDRVYVGRNPQDAATLDRFAFMPVEYDEQLERTLASNADWCRYVQAVRAEVFARGMRVIVSPRATLNGCTALAAGDTWGEAADAWIWDKMPDEDKRQLQSSIPMRDYEPF